MQHIIAIKRGGSELIGKMWRNISTSIGPMTTTTTKRLEHIYLSANNNQHRFRCLRLFRSNSTEEDLGGGSANCKSKFERCVQFYVGIV
mmetsp:Transcript_11469/g.24875  ORF Transcript_11469/g.24875 Transcript_11469/m.24875 type:complete len:89 (+) Transcript_11469:683-949(+)